MKKLASYLLLMAVIFTTINFTSCGKPESLNPQRPEFIPESDTSAFDVDSDVFNKIAEDDKLILSYNELTTDVRVTVKETGYTYTTESVDGEFVDRGYLFNLNYYDEKGVLRELSSRIDSIDLGQFLATKIDNGIKVQYGLGDVNFKLKFPLALSPERFELLSGRFEEEYDKFEFASYYNLIDFNDEKYNDLSVNELALEKAAYPLASNEPWYYFNQNVSSNVRQVRYLNGFFAENGYTDEDLEIDNKRVDTSNVSQPEFSITVYYTLENNTLSVKVPEKEIYHPEDCKIQNIQLLNSFLEFDDSYDGQFLLPDGSGSIMDFNNNLDELGTRSAYVQMYGVDQSRMIAEKTAYYDNAILPVYGVTLEGKRKTQDGFDETEEAEQEKADNEVEYEQFDKQGCFVIIEDGDSFSGIEATSKNTDDSISKNAIWTDYRINESIKIKSFSYTVDSDATYAKYQFQRYSGELKQRYYFLTGEDSTYSGMANLYSDYLFSSVPQTAPKDYYSTVEFINVVQSYETFFGINYMTKKNLTSFAQVSEISSDLQNNGFNNINVKLSGWFNGGYEHGLLDKLKVVKESGGEDEFLKLKDKLNEMKIGFYPDADVQFSYYSQGEISRKKQALTINNRTAWNFLYNPILFNPMGYRVKHILNMQAIIKNLNDFLDNYSKFDHYNVSFRSIGSEVNANYDEKNFMERQETLNNLLKLIEGVKNQGYSIMGTGGIAPFIKYLDVINNMPLNSANFETGNHSVPFTAMVLSGYVNYTGDVINLNNGERKDLLKLIESNAGAYFTLTGEFFEEIWSTNSDFLFSTYYNDIKEDVISKFNYVAEALDGVYGIGIKEHTQLAEKVFKTTYDNDTYIIVNYSSNDFVTQDGVKAPANDYAKVEGGAINND